MKCNNTKCGVENPPGAVFCMNCGSPLSSKTTCPYCGSEVDGAAKFCNHCGKELSPAVKKGWKDLAFHTFKWLTLWCVLFVCYCQFSYSHFTYSYNNVQTNETSAYRCDVSDKCFHFLKGAAIDYDTRGKAFSRGLEEYRRCIDNCRALLLILGGMSLAFSCLFKIGERTRRHTPTKSILIIALCTLTFLGCKNNRQNENNYVDCFACNGTTQCFICRGNGILTDPISGLIKTCNACGGGLKCGICKGTGKVRAPENEDDWNAYNKMKQAAQPAVPSAYPQNTEFNTNECTSCHGTGKCELCGGWGALHIEYGLAEHGIIDCSECVGGRCKYCYGKGYR